MARRKQGSKHKMPVLESLEEIDSLAERIAHWIADHVRLSIALVVTLLVFAGGFQVYRSHAQAALDDASNALAAVRSAYFEAMGASAGSEVIPELANPASQVGVREEFSKRFAELAENNPGTVQAALAWLEAGNLLEESGEPGAALEAWKKGLESAPANETIRGTLLIRIATELEDQGSWQAAADSHAEAAELEQFPLRFWAMADAARCFDRAGDPSRALALLERVEADAPSLRLPEHMRARLRELRTRERPSVSAS